MSIYFAALLRAMWTCCIYICSVRSAGSSSMHIYLDDCISYGTHAYVTWSWNPCCSFQPPTIVFLWLRSQSAIAETTVRPPICNFFFKVTLHRHALWRRLHSVVKLRQSGMMRSSALTVNSLASLGWWDLARYIATQRCFLSTGSKTDTKAWSVAAEYLYPRDLADPPKKHGTYPVKLFSRNSWFLARLANCADCIRCSSTMSDTSFTSWALCWHVSRLVLKSLV
jgi:hypothetical protein